MSTIDVVYLWCPAKWESLAYSVNSVKRHFRELGTLWVLNDIRPDLSCDYNFFNIANIGEFTDDRMIFKIRAFITQTGIQEFLLMSDDKYFMDDVSLAELAEPIAVQNMKDKIRPQVLYTDFEHRTWQTVDKLKTLGYPLWNYANHLPHYVEGRKFLDACNALGDTFQIPMGYHNFYFRGRSRMLKDLNWRAGFYKEIDAPAMYEALQGKRFLNHDDHGLTDHLKSYIINRYG